MNYPQESDGGHAFPRPYGLGHSGMTLRDYFATAALQGFATNEHCNDLKHTAEAAYELADCMLRARNKNRL